MQLGKSLLRCFSHATRLMPVATSEALAWYIGSSAFMFARIATFHKNGNALRSIHRKGIWIQCTHILWWEQSSCFECGQSTTQIPMEETCEVIKNWLHTAFSICSQLHFPLCCNMGRLAHTKLANDYIILCMHLESDELEWKEMHRLSAHSTTVPAGHCLPDCRCTNCLLVSTTTAISTLRLIFLVVSCMNACNQWQVAGPTSFTSRTGWMLPACLGVPQPSRTLWPTSLNITIHHSTEFHQPHVLRSLLYAWFNYIHILFALVS